MSCPSADAAFYPSALFVEETSILFSCFGGIPPIRGFGFGSDTVTSC
jgi:hypothetical protein